MIGGFGRVFMGGHTPQNWVVLGSFIFLTWRVMIGPFSLGSLVNFLAYP
jgi:hypothetical protein